MRKIILVLLLLLPTSVLFAQNSNTQIRFRGGAILGLNATQVDGDNIVGYHKLGLNAGFISEIPINQKWFVSLEILFNQKGSQSSRRQDSLALGTPSLYPADFKIKLNYADVPILINYQDKKNISFGLGFSVGWLVYDTLRIESYLQGVPPSSLYTISKLRKTDEDVLVNFDYSITQHFIVNFRFAYSFLAFGQSPYSKQYHYGMYNNILTCRMIYLFF